MQPSRYLLFWFASDGSAARLRASGRDRRPRVRSHGVLVMDIKSLLLVVACVGCGPTASSDSAAVHIDKLREELTNATNERDQLKQQLAASKLKYDQLLLVSTRDLAEAVAKPKLVIGRYIAALRRHKASSASERLPEGIRDMLADFLREVKYGDGIVTPLKFDGFAQWMDDYDGDIPAGLALKVNWSEDTDLKAKYQDLIDFDQSLEDAETDDEMHMIYYEREMKKLGPFADGIITP